LIGHLFTFFFVFITLYFFSFSLLFFLFFLFVFFFKFSFRRFILDFSLVIFSVDNTFFIIPKIQSGHGSRFEIIEQCFY